MWPNKKPLSRNRTCKCVKLSNHWPICVIFCKCWLLPTRWSGRFRARSVTDWVTVNVNSVVRALMLVWAKMTMTDKDLLIQVANLLILSTSLVLWSKLRLKDSGDSSLGQQKESHTCIYSNMMTKPMWEMPEGQFILLFSKMDLILKRRSREFVTHSQDKDMKFQSYHKSQQTSKKWRTQLLMQEMSIRRPRNPWSNSWVFSTESQAKQVKMTPRRHPQQSTFTRCSWPKRKHYT